MRRNPAPPLGFSLLELMVVLVIFLIVTGAVFGLLNVAQIRYRSEQQFLDSLQGARTGIDQLSRDIHRAGYPPLNAYDSNSASWLAAGGVPTWRIAVPFVGMVGANIDQTCLVDTANPTLSTCVIPGPFELILESDLEPDGRVDWIYYRLETPGNALSSPPTGRGFTRTLYRAVTPKDCAGPPWITSPMTCTSTGTGPGSSPRVEGTPFVDNIIQDPAAAVGAGNPALFTYVCADMDGDGLLDPTCTPENIQEIYILIQARAPTPDLQTRQIRALTLQSMARRLNPSQ